MSVTNAFGSNIFGKYILFFCPHGNQPYSEILDRNLRQKSLTEIFALLVTDTDSFLQIYVSNKEKERRTIVIPHFVHFFVGWCVLIQTFHYPLTQIFKVLALAFRLL